MHDPDRTVAVICGASSWPRLDRFTAATAFSRTAQGLTAYLTGDNGLGLAAENVLDLFDSEATAVEHFDRMKQFLEHHMRRTRSRHGRGMLVLVAYIGHGAFFEAQRFYCLLLRDTHEPAPVETSLRVQALARTLKHTAPRSSRIVILDSCFAAHAVHDFQSDIQQVASAKAQEAVESELDEIPGAPGGPGETAPGDVLDGTGRDADAREETYEAVTALDAGGGLGGVALLCASSSKDPAQLASRDSYTLFGQALLDVLRHGDARNPGPMTLRQVRRLIGARLLPIRDAPRPQVHSPEQDGRDLADEPLFPNPAHPSPPPMRITRPRRTRRILGALVTTVSVVCAAVAVALFHPVRDDPCGTDIATVVWDGDECIGLSDGSYNFFRPPARDQVVQDQIQLVLDTIRDQNSWTADLHEQHPERPYFTLVNLQALTAPKHGSGTAADLTAERESLEGLVVAQRKQIDAVGPGEPLIRILIGNAGRGTAKGPKLAAQIVEAARTDPTIVGVVGFNMSNQATQDTVRVLAEGGIPMVATTLSLDSLADRNPLFIQVTPQNRREAATVAGFAANALTTPPRVRIYYSGDESDLYSTNLRDDAGYWFGRFGFTVETNTYAPSGLPATTSPGDDHAFGNAFDAGTDICTGDGIAFFSGRGVPDFGEFLRGASTCEHRATTIIGADDVTKHVADPVARSREALAGVPYYFVSFAPAPVTDSEPAAIATRFYDLLRQRFAFEQEPESERSLDGHAALDYDGAQVYLTAVRELHRTSPGQQPTLAAVSRQLTGLGVLPGVTGTFHYGVRPRPNVPRNKAVTILRVENGEVVRRIYAYCGDYPDRPFAAAPWCPPDADEQPAGR
ncbi:caspase family protein [Nocardia sp. NPDC003345]